MADDRLTYRYTFDLGSGLKREAVVHLDPHSLQLQMPVLPQKPEWTRLSCCQCSNCPLKEDTDPDCPAALSLVEVVRLFDQTITRRLVNVTITTATRTYQKETSLQEGLSSLVGLCMASSGCPILARLRPLVVNHLPFATVDETAFRVLSMYLLAQFFIAKRTGKPDWTLSGLAALYEEVHQVNQSFYQRLALASREDASPAALIILDLFSQSLSFAVSEQDLSTIERLFSPYFE
jgi:hypothetical protein